MPFYMFEGRYTSAALKAMVANPQDREPEGRKLVEALGGKLHHLFFCLGAEDVVALIEAPDDETAVAGAMALGASGAFSAGATRKLMTPKEAMASMKKAQAAAAVYRPATA